jgi:hypothetical protein
MAAFDPATLERWRALAIVDRDGSTVGTISEFYLDRETGHPTWALVTTGLFGTSQSFVPLVHATEISDGLQVPYEKRHIKDSPSVDLHDELTPEEEAALFAHYGVAYEPSAETAPEHGVPVPGDPAASAPSAAADAEQSSAAGGPEAGGPEAAAAGDGEPGSGEPPGPVAADPGTAEAVGGAGAGQGPGDPPEEVPAEPGSTDQTAVAEDDGGPAAADATETLPVEHEPAEADGGHHPPDADPVTAGVPDEPGTAAPDNPGPIDQDAMRPETVEPPDSPPDPDQLSAGLPDPDRAPDSRPDQLRDSLSDPDRPGDPDQLPDGRPDPGQLRDGPGDPDLGRTAPVEPGLPGSTGASPYGATATVEKGAGPTGHPTEEPVRAPAEAGWAPGAAGSFEEHDPVDPPAGASDRWREAKLAAERDRIARATAAQPEERSPLERARRRLERLVGVGQEHDDHDEISLADREEAERARRARLGLDEEDHRR